VRSSLRHWLPGRVVSQMTCYGWSKKADTHTVFRVSAFLDHPVRVDRVGRYNCTRSVSQSAFCDSTKRQFSSSQVIVDRRSLWGFVIVAGIVSDRNCRLYVLSIGWCKMRGARRGMRKKVGTSKVRGNSVQDKNDPALYTLACTCPHPAFYTCPWLVRSA